MPGSEPVYPARFCPDCMVEMVPYAASGIEPGPSGRTQPDVGVQTIPYLCRSCGLIRFYAAGLLQGDQ
jgi:hypothetical protein